MLGGGKGHLSTSAALALGWALHTRKRIYHRTRHPCSTRKRTQFLGWRLLHEVLNFDGSEPARALGDCIAGET